MSAKTRYDSLATDRSQFLNIAEEAAKLTLPYLIRGEEEWHKGAKELPTPWQSIGAKGAVTLAAKLQLALVPPNTSFFKLQVNDAMLGQVDPQVKTELDLSFAKIERTIMDSIAASDDRVVIHQALKHLVVAGNALVFMGKEGLKLFPLQSYASKNKYSDCVQIATSPNATEQEKIMNATGYENILLYQ